MKYNWRYICIALLTESVKSCKLVKSQDFRVRELFTFTCHHKNIQGDTTNQPGERVRMSESTSTLTTGRLSTNIKSAKYVCTVFFYLRMDMRAPILVISSRFESIAYIFAFHSFRTRYWECKHEPVGSIKCFH